MTYREALQSGYKAADYEYQMGYVSRKTEVMEQEVLTAGGRRKGQKYILLPNPHSTRFCYRLYLVKED